MADRGLRRILPGALTVLAVGVLWAGLLVPDDPDLLSAGALLRVPVEAVVLLACALLLRGRARMWVAWLLGLLASLLVLVKALDVGFLLTFYRPFDPLSDPSYVGSGWGVMVDGLGAVRAVLVAVGAGLLAVGLLVGMPAAAVRVSRVVGRHRAVGAWVLGVLVVSWTVGAVAQVRAPDGLPVASADTSSVAVTHVRAVREGLADRAEFARSAAQDAYATVPATDLLAGLRGKDVVLVFVESYGRVALQDPALAPAVTAALGRASTRLGAAGFGARSAFLTSPTFGGLSWLAHSTLQTGLRISDQVRYDAVLTSSRVTLSSSFARAGWRTVLDSPANEHDFGPATSFYRYDTVYDARNVGYAGPAFGYAPVPDQYTLASLAARELSGGRAAPLFAEVDMVTSHAPWAPLPRMVDPAALGDGSVLGPVLAEAPTATDVWSDPAQVRAAYAESIAYSLDALTSFVETAHDDNLVVVMLGDHQPSSVISGKNASHDVPITVVAHDPAVLQRVSDWAWQPGWAPGPSAPVWPMESFRDRFLAAYARSPGGS